VPIKLNK